MSHPCEIQQNLFFKKKKLALWSRHESNQCFDPVHRCWSAVSQFCTTFIFLNPSPSLLEQKLLQTQDLIRRLMSRQ